MARRNGDGEIEKAGCLVVDPEAASVLVVVGGDGRVSLPKGHMEIGENARQAAVRETFEETGWVVALDRELPELRYVSGNSGNRVRLRMFHALGVLRAGSGSERCDWIPASEAADRLAGWGALIKPAGTLRVWCEVVLGAA